MLPSNESPKILDTMRHVKIEDGYMYINDRPGLGVDIDERECAKHPFKPTYIRHYVGTLTQIRPDDATSYYSK